MLRIVNGRPFSGQTQAEINQKIAAAGLSPSFVDTEGKSWPSIAAYLESGEDQSSRISPNTEAIPIAARCCSV